MSKKTAAKKPTSKKSKAGVPGNATAAEAQAKVAADKAAAKQAEQEAKAAERAAEEAEREAAAAPVDAAKLPDSEIRSIPMDRIDLAQKGEQVRPFDETDPEYLRKVEFAKTNRKWVVPIVVRKGENNRFVLIGGRHRFEASKVNNWAEIEARVYESMDGATALAIGLIENLRAKAMTPTEVATAVAQILKRKQGANISTIASDMNCTKNTVRNILALNNLVASARRKVDADKIPLANAYALASLPQEVQEENEGAWIDSAENTKTIKFVKAVQEFLKGLKGDATGEVRRSSAERARNARNVVKPLGQTELESTLEDARAGDPTVIGKVNESYQDGLIDGLLIALGRKPLLPPTRVAGFQPKPASARSA